MTVKGQMQWKGLKKVCCGMTMKKTRMLVVCVCVCVCVCVEDEGTESQIDIVPLIGKGR